MRLALLSHANVQPTARWINDTLLYVNVWWGRVAGSDLIIDVSSGEFIYRAMFFWDLGYSSPAAGDASEGDLPRFTFRLEHTQGAPPPKFRSLTLTVNEEVHEITIVTLPPMITDCFAEATVEEIQALFELLRDFLEERAANLPPRPPDTVCRNCTIYTMSWSMAGGEEGSFAFSEQRPLRYPALDGLLPLMERLYERSTREGSCAA